MLGLTDGLQVEITKGLAAGDTILEFTPIADGAGAAVDCTPDYDPAECFG